ncbi:hypothetical protein YC2023_083543 [Brassica napus]
MAAEANYLVASVPIWVLSGRKDGTDNTVEAYCCCALLLKGGLRNVMFSYPIRFDGSTFRDIQAKSESKSAAFKLSPMVRERYNEPSKSN